MSVKVKCPSCQQELTAKDESVGRKAVCPKCRTRFPITSPREGGGPPTASVAERGAQPREPIADEGSKGVLSPAEDDGAGRRDTPAKLAAADAGQADERPARSATPGKSGLLPAQRPAKTAKFVAAEATATRVDLGADGELPQLVLREGKKGEVKEEEKADSEGQSSKPLLLVALFCFSICLTVVMLLFDPQGESTDTKTKAEARGKIVKYYIGKSGNAEFGATDDTSANSPSLEPYQRLLRQALQAHHRGDFALERDLYRKVLDLLHDESKNKITGLTGMVDGGLPNDKDLEDQLSTLLR